MDSGFEIKYRKLFRTYYANLLFYAKRIVGDDDAEEIGRASCRERVFPLV